MIDRFRDDFTGSAGSLDGRTPDGVGGAYTTHPWSDASLSQLPIDGSGNLDIYQTTSYVLAVSEITAVTANYSLELKFKISNDSAAAGDSVNIVAYASTTTPAPTGTSLIELTVNWDGYSGGWRVSLNLYNSSFALIYTSSNVTFSTTGATQTFLVEVTDAGVTMKLDGVTLSTTTVTPDVYPNAVWFYVAKNIISGTLTGVIESVALFQESPPLTEVNLTHGGDYVAVGRGGGIGALGRVGRYSTYAYGRTSQYVPGFNGVHGGEYALTGTGGGTLAAKCTAPVLTASATWGNLGKLVQKMPAPTLAASATWGDLGRLEQAHRGRYALRAMSGGRLARTTPRLTTSLAATVWNVGRAMIRLPSGQLLATGSTPNQGRAELRVPAARMLPLAAIRAAVPTLRLAASALPLITVEYEGYSVTLMETEAGTQTATTRYTDFPFERIVRFGDQYYGVAVDGIYALGGDTFDGDPIVAVVNTAATDHGAPTLKRPRALFVAGRVGADMQVAVVAGETEAYAYDYVPVQKTGAVTARVLFGRGTRMTYGSYRFTNTEGEDFMLDGFTPEVDVLRRTI